MQQRSGNRSAGSGFNLRALEVFVAIVEEGSLTAAAARLGVSQPAVSIALRELETSLESRLVDREVRPIRPTQPGRVLYRRAARLLQDAQSTRRAVRLAGADTLPSIWLGLVVSVTATGAPLIRALQRMADELRVVSGLTPELSRALVAHEIDLLITSDPMDEVANLERRVVLHEPFVLAVPGEFGRRARTATLRAVADAMPMVRYTSRSIIGTVIEGYLRRTGIDAPHRLEFDSSNSVLAMVAAGLGWAITTPLCLVQGGADLRRIVVVPLPGEPLSRSLYLVNRRGEFVGAVERIRDVTAEQLREVVSTSLVRDLRWMLDEVRYA